MENKYAKSLILKLRERLHAVFRRRAFTGSKGAHARRLVCGAGAGGEQRAAGQEHCALERWRRPFPELATGGQFPQRGGGRAVFALRDEAPAIRREGEDAGDIGKVRQLCRRSHIPETDRAVVPATNEPPAIRREIERADAGAMPVQLPYFLTCGKVPQVDGLVGAARGEELAIRRNCQGIAAPLRNGQCPGALPSRDIK